MSFRALALVAALLAASARADEVFLTEAQAPVALFGKGMIGEPAELHLSDAEVRQLSLAVGRQVEQRDYRTLVIRPGPGAARDGGVAGAPGPAVGTIVMLEVTGQTLPITFAVGVRTDQTLQDVQVMVYREPYGKEINERRFRVQFKGKKASDPLRVDRDIAAVSGATISSRSAAYAARKGLGLAAIQFGRGSHP